MGPHKHTRTDVHILYKCRHNVHTSTDMYTQHVHPVFKVSTICSLKPLNRDPGMEVRKMHHNLHLENSLRTAHQNYSQREQGAQQIMQNTSNEKQE